MLNNYSNRLKAVNDEIKAIIFDFGDVICFWDTDKLGEKHSLALGLPKDTIGNIIWDYLKAASAGTYDSIHDYFEKITPPLPPGTDIAKEVFAEMEASANIDQRMIDFILTLKQKYKIGLLSNFPRGIEDYITHRFHIEQCFNAVVSSYDIKKKKPAHDVFHYAANQLSVTPEQCIFIDDSEPNVQAAIATGMQGVVFQNAADCMQELEHLLTSPK